MHSNLSRLTHPLTIASACGGLLLFGLYLQHAQGLTPCPMCIVQRYCLVLVGVAALLIHATRNAARAAFTVVAAGFAFGGAATAARQSILQWFPPEIASCGRDFYGMIENYALSKAIPLIFRGSGDCSAVDWTFLGGTIANWAFLCFVALGFALIYSFLKARNQ